MEKHRKKEVSQLLSVDHSELDEMLGELFEALDAGDVEQIYKRLDIFWARLAMHIRAEHLHLFPAILQAVKPESEQFISATDVQSTIEKLQEDHNFFMRELTDAIKQIRVLRENNQNEKQNNLLIVREKVFGVYNLLRTHNELEEADVYQWADALLKPFERADLNEKMRRELVNLPPRFGKSEEIF